MAPARLAELAALGTAMCWAVSALSFQAAGKRIGSLSLNVVRLTIGLVLLAGWGVVTGHGPWPTQMGVHEWWWLSLSALFGFVLGDYFLFRAYVELGPRLSSVVMASAPMWAALVGWLTLDETLTAREMMAIAVTLGGIAWAVGSKRGGPRAGAHAKPCNGVIYAFAGSFGQASGLVLSKIGMGDHDPFAATQVRVFAGLVGFAVVCTALRWWPRVTAAVRDRQAMRPAALGSVFGPFLGVALSLFAVQHTATGVAATLMAMTPILLIPVSMWRRESVGVGGVLGAVLAVTGVVLLVTG